MVVRWADHAATPDAAGVHARRVRTRPFGIAGETRDEDPASSGFRGVSGKENETNVATLPSSSTLRLVDRRRLEAKRSKARALAAVERERVNDSDGFGFATGKSTGTDPVLAAAEALREEMDEALAFDAEAAERALDESTANSHARLMQLIRGVIRATAGTDGEEDEGLEGRAAAERDDDTDEVAANRRRPNAPPRPRGYARTTTPRASPTRPSSRNSSSPKPARST